MPTTSDFPVTAAIASDDFVVMVVQVSPGVFRTRRVSRDVVGAVGPIGPTGGIGLTGAVGPAGPTGPSGGSIPGIVSTADANTLWLTADENVGIGTSAPDGRLHVLTSSIGVQVADPNSDDLVVENNGPCGITIFSINNDQGVLTFGDVDDADIGQIVYEHNGDSMLFICNTFNVMTIVASQRVGIGTNAPDGKLHIFSASSGLVSASVTADELTLENSDHCGLSILTPNDKVGVIFFGDVNDNDVGQISYNHLVDTLTFTVNTVNVVDVVGTEMKPNADNVFGLGTAIKRWTSLFAMTGVFTTSLNLTGLTASRAVVSDASKNFISSATTLAELAFVSGVTSAIQTQLNSKGYLGIPKNSQSADYGIVAADMGKAILHPGTDAAARLYTLPAHATIPISVDDAVVTIINQNGAGVITIAITTDTMRLAGAGTVGSRTLAANGIATATKVTTTEWIISGTGLT